MLKFRSLILFLILCVGYNESAQANLAGQVDQWIAQTLELVGSKYPEFRQDDGRSNTVLLAQDEKSPEPKKNC